MNKRPRPAPDSVTGHWGIFGGMFDPVHRGHVTLAEDLCHAEQLAGLILVPGVQPPHRPDSPRASFEHRSAMLSLAFADRLPAIISDVETRLQSSGYTLEVVRALKAEYPDARYTFLIGADQLEKFSTWFRPEDVLKEVDIVAGTRPGFTVRGGAMSHQVTFVATRAVDVSSTQIRDAVRKGCSVDSLAQLVPAPDAQYIIENRLYQ